MRTYIITGMGRSGTSFLAESLKKNGVNIGDKFYMGENPHHGYENQELVDITKNILVKSGQGWGIHCNPEKKQNLNIAYKVNKPKIKKFIDKNKKESWGIKEPRLSLMLDNFLEDIKDIDDDPFIYVAFRKPKYIAKSLKKLRGKLKKEDLIEVAKEYNRRLIKSLETFLEL